MNTLHKDINKIIPFGEFLRGFINQRYITAKLCNTSAVALQKPCSVTATALQQHCKRYAVTLQQLSARFYNTPFELGSSK